MAQGVALLLGGLWWYFDTGCFQLLVDHGGELRGRLRLERGPLRVVRGEERRLGERAHVVRDRIVSKSVGVVVGFFLSLVAVVVVVVAALCINRYQ